MTFTDLHSHIAWDVDDGIPSKEEAEMALDMAKDDGIIRILSTPHITPGKTDYVEYSRIKERQVELDEMAQLKGIEIFYGGEVMINNHFLEALEDGWLPRINGTRYMLVEYNVRWDYHSLDYPFDPLYEMSVRNLKPVVAHVERYFHENLDWDVLQEWYEEGYVFQINATSLLGRDSKQAMKNAWKLLEKGYAHVISTDTHRTEGYRIENLSLAYEQVKKKFGEENANLLFNQNPIRILEGKSVEEMKVQKKWRWFH